MRREASHEGALVLATVSVLLLAAPGALRAECSKTTIGIDPSIANSSGSPLLAEAIGETFIARDTLITSFTVWHVPEFVVSRDVGIKAYIVPTDSTGAPITAEPLWRGALQIPSRGDGVHPVEVTWTIDPPLVLPHRGRYAWFILQDLCHTDFSILAVNNVYADRDAFEEGVGWVTSRGTCVDLDASVFEAPHGDLIFKMEFCHDVATSTRRTTWGTLKSIYR